MSSVEQEILAAAQEVAALFAEHPFVPRTWVEVQRFVAAAQRLTAADATPRTAGVPVGPEPEPEREAAWGASSGAEAQQP